MTCYGDRRNIQHGLPIWKDGWPCSTHDSPSNVPKGVGNMRLQCRYVGLVVVADLYFLVQLDLPMIHKQILKFLQAYVDAPLEKAMRRSLELIDTEYVSPIMDPGRVTKLLAPNTQEPTEFNNATQNDEISPHQESKLTNLVHIERRANLLEAQISHHRHVTLFNTRREQFDTIEKEGRKILQPALAIEMTKADKREGGLVRRFDSNAGEYTRLVTEMISSRASSLGYVESILANWDISDSNRVKVYLEEISLLKHCVIDMREERIRQDELVVEKILQTKKVLEEDIFLAC